MCNYLVEIKEILIFSYDFSYRDEAVIESVFLQIHSETEKECEKRELDMKSPAQWDILRKQLKDLLVSEQTEQNQLKTLISKSHSISTLCF